MFKPFARPSRTKDRLGIAVLAATALLYATAASYDGSALECNSCDQIPATPAAAPVEREPAANPARSVHVQVTDKPAAENEAPQSPIPSEDVPSTPAM